MSQSVRRAARIIDAIAQEPRSVNELAASFDLHRSTMFRELADLAEVGYVRRGRDGKYSLGLHLVSLSKLAVDNLDLREAAHVHIRALHKVVGNTIHVAALMEHSIVYVDKVEDSAGVRMYSRIGKSVEAYCTGVGKAVLAELDLTGRNAVLQGTSWKRYTPNTLSTRAALDKQLAEIEKRHWAVDDGEHEGFVNCIAVPILDSHSVAGALSVTAIRMVADLERLKEHLPLIQKTASLISAELG
ncbi:IclR family transcriptional regulator [Paeniglutamicibacter antarcticus]|uniref:IclR family transcriptional regulator n=1 Tax=Arthrobacter terrae TaxID=2935737 RepID=A0A931CRZ5_9MICC|nr:IclR family transcriptional regulator [Arthrobacter terrae]MBG0741510.1 IclR family transcriptional regulator [Arthrobacter terrae]